MAPWAWGGGLRLLRVAMVRAGVRRSGGGESCEPGQVSQAVVDDAGPGPVGVEVDDPLPCGAHVAGGGGEQLDPQGLGCSGKRGPRVFRESKVDQTSYDYVLRFAAKGSTAHELARPQKTL